jgi:hypothetical protein
MFISTGHSALISKASYFVRDDAAGVSIGTDTIIAHDPHELFHLGCLLQVAATELQKRKDAAR